MRQGIEEMIQHEKSNDKPPKVYTYEKAVERYLLTEYQILKYDHNIYCFSCKTKCFYSIFP